MYFLTLHYWIVKCSPNKASLVWGSKWSLHITNPFVFDLWEWGHSFVFDLESRTGESLFLILSPKLLKSQSPYVWGRGGGADFQAFVPRQKLIKSDIFWGGEEVQIFQLSFCVRNWQNLEVPYFLGVGAWVWGFHLLFQSLKLTISQSYIFGGGGVPTFLLVSKSVKISSYVRGGAQLLFPSPKL